MMKKYLLSLVCALCAMTALALDPAQRGDSAFAKNDYIQALELYRQALDKDGVSSDLYYNIGNTYYRLNDLGHSVISYERALKIDPSNESARANLEFVKTKIVDRPEDDSTFLSNMHKKIVSWYSPDAWAWIAFVLFVIVIGAVAVYIFTSSVNARKAGFFGAIVVLVLFVYAFVIAWSTANVLDSHETAVVVVPTTNLPIHEGTKLEIVDSLSTPDDPSTSMWYDVKINNTSRAWVSAADVERI